MYFYQLSGAYTHKSIFGTVFLFSVEKFDIALDSKFAAHGTKSPNQWNSREGRSEIVETTLVVSRFCFLRGRVSYIRDACNYRNRTANFKSWISVICLQSVSFLVSQILCRI